MNWTISKLESVGGTGLRVTIKNRQVKVFYGKAIDLFHRIKYGNKLNYFKFLRYWKVSENTP